MRDLLRPLRLRRGLLLVRPPLPLPVRRFGKTPIEETVGKDGLSRRDTPHGMTTPSDIGYKHPYSGGMSAPTGPAGLTSF